MKEIQLTRGKVALIDDCDFEKVSSYRWIAFFDRGRWYAEHRKTKQVNGKKFLVERFLMHRLIMEAPEGVQIDHRDCDGLNNRRGNLRLANHSQNQMNRRPYPNGSGFKGVSVCAKDPKRFNAWIKKDQKTHWLGVFETPIEAAKAYNEQAKLLFGDYARLNPV